MDTATPTENETNIANSDAQSIEGVGTTKAAAPAKAKTKPKSDKVAVEKPQSTKEDVKQPVVAVVQRNNAKTVNKLTQETQNQKNQNANRSTGKQRNQQRGVKSAFDIVATTSAKSVSYRKIQLRNKQLENNIKFCERIASSIMTITGSLVRCKKFDIQEEFDAYIEVLLMTYTQEVTETLADFERKVSAYTNDAYEFVDTGEPGNIRVEIRSNHVACLLDLILSIDKLMTVASHLEKTPSLTSPELYNLYSQWITIPRQINGRLMSLVDVLDSNYRLKVKVKNDAKAMENVNFDDVLKFMTDLKNEQSQANNSDNSTLLANTKKAKQAPVSSQEGSAPKVATASTEQKLDDVKPAETSVAEKPITKQEKASFLDWETQ